MNKSDYGFKVLKDVLIYLIFAVLSASTTAFSQDSARRLAALTFDDLPIARFSVYSQSEGDEIFSKLIESIKSKNGTAIGFANEGKLYTAGNLDSLKLAMLERWLSAGFDLGNHTYSHPDINTTNVEDYINNIERGEKNIRPLIEKRGKKLEYFRHPYLHTGLTAEIKNRIDTFLKDKGYLVASVTIDNSESAIALAYDNAFKKADSAAMKKIGRDYLAYMDTVFAWYERVSVQYFGRSINQVLLLHSNKLNADYISCLIELIRRRGYEIASLKDAMKDEVYQLKDEFTGKKGISWIFRWVLSSINKDAVFGPEPELPQYIYELGRSK